MMCYMLGQCDFGSGSRQVATYFDSGGQEHLMPVAVDPKSACHCVSVCHGDGSAAVECHRVPQVAQPSATRPWNAPQRDAWSDELERGHTAQLSPASALPGA